MTIEEVLAKTEYQIFDRKSIQIAPTDLSKTICAFANADGGIIAIGISDKTKRIEGVDNHIQQMNELLTAPIDFCNPSVPIETEMVPCTNYLGQPDHILLMKIEASSLLHANHADEVYLRVGDKSKKMSFNDRLTLMYAKGLRYFEDEPVYVATLEDIDMDFVAEYIKKIGYGKSPVEYLLENKKFAEKKADGSSTVSTAAILLFGKYPQQFFPRATIRFIRYDGVEAKVGAEMNVIKDISFDGRILDQVKAAIEYIKTQMKEKTYLGHDGIFITEEEYSEFVRTEIVVNAATHRDYGIKGTDIQIKMFDDRLEVDSPGILAGLVKKDNIRHTHFSRNPKIAAFLKEYGYVKEYGEGVDRMCLELEAIGLPDPTFDNSTFILKTTVVSAAYKKSAVDDQKSGGLVENPAVSDQKAGDSEENPAVSDQKAGGSEYMVLLETIVALCEKNHYKQPTVKNIIKLYENIEVNQVFGAAYVRKILDCADSTARELMSKLRGIGVVIPIEGNGKGKYRFKYQSETKKL